VLRTEAAGSFRRRRETVGDLDVVAAAIEPAPVVEAFTRWHRAARVEGAGPTRATVVLRRDVQVDLRVVPPASFGAAWIYLTGSQQHNVALRHRAVERGWTLSEYGLFDARRGGKAGKARAASATSGAAREGSTRGGAPRTGARPAGAARADDPGGRAARGDAAASAAPPGERLAGTSEEEVYAALGLAWIPPELREDAGEIEAAALDPRGGGLPVLLRREDLRGDLQMHSTWSDGRASVEAMVAAAAARGHAYVALTDHGPGLPIVRGLDGSALAAQAAEIARVQAAHPQVRVLRSLEVDVLGDGTLALADEHLATLDLVVIAVHGQLRLGREEQTRRYLRALAHPRAHILAHPTARRLGRRGPVDADWDAVFAAAAAHGVAVEANASPERLDLDGELLRCARDAGCKVVVSTDAHSVRELDHLRWGVDQARRGWLRREDVLDTLPLADLLAALRIASR
jgi:DNA polymerase (family 10)